MIAKLLLMLMLIASPIFAQQPDSLFQDMLYDNSLLTLEKAISDASKRHAIYSYNLANATTPGFKPVLLPDDQRELALFFPESEKYFSKVVVEHIMTKMAENNRRYSAYYALYRKKLDNWRQVMTLGKK